MASTLNAPRVRRESLRGSTVTRHSREITPIARQVTVTWPGGRVLWQTPTAVEVRERGRVRRIPIRDATSRLILTIALAELAAGAALWWALVRRHPRGGRATSSAWRT